MKENFFKNGKLTGKSAAAVIGFSLAVIAALGIFSYNRSANELEEQLSGIKSNTSETETTVTEAADKANAAVNNVPMEEEAVDAEVNTADVEETVNAASENAYSGIDGAVIRPVSGDILNEFSDGQLVKSRTLNVWKTHDGIDIAAEQGEKVKSAAAGTVTSVSEDPLMGVTVIIDHGSGYEGYYSNLGHDVSVSEGDTVDAGSLIGEVGNTAESELSEESHLHFGIKKNGSWTDPADVLSGEGS